MLKIAKNSSYRHNIDLRFSGKNTYFKQLFRHFLFLFYVILHAKNTFYDGIKKFCAKNFGTLCTCTKVGCVKETLLEKPELF